jgi:hypothetical protein
MADHPEPETRPSQYWPVFIPLLILAVTYLGWTVFQTTQLMHERDALAKSYANQEKPFQDSKKLRDSLDKIARETQSLANRGNKSALLIVDQLRKRGITINPEPAPQSPPASSAAPAPSAPSK